MFDVDNRCVTSGNYHTLTIVTPVAQGKEPTDYNSLSNKPSINGVELVGDVDIVDIMTQAGLPDISGVPSAPLTLDELESIVGE